MDSRAGHIDAHDCDHFRHGNCSMVPRHGLLYRVLIAVLGTTPGLLIILLTSRMGEAISAVANFVPEMFWAILAVALLAYLFIIWRSAHKHDRTSIEDYATTSAALFSTIVATLPFLKEIAH